VNRNFVEMLCALSDAGADYLIVGAYALAAHDCPRATGDLDIWVRASAENAPRVLRAIDAFGMPIDGLSPAELTAPDLVVQFGFEPQRIDIMTSITGVMFDDAWPNRMYVDIEGRQHPVIGRQDLITNKRATGREKDLLDLKALNRR